MPIAIFSRPPSPTSVTMPYLLRYTAMFTNNNGVAYDLYETMNRMEYFKQGGQFRWDAAQRNIETIMAIREARTLAMDARFYKCYLPLPGDGPSMVAYSDTRDFFRDHGVRVSMDTFVEQDQNGVTDAVAAQEDAHLLWNTYEDFDEMSFNTMNLDDDEITQLITQPIAEWESFNTE